MNVSGAITARSRANPSAIMAVPPSESAATIVARRPTWSANQPPSGLATAAPSP
jgi:hypothetical protein